MATVKKPANGAAKPSASRALTVWEQEMAAAAKQQNAVEKIFGTFKAISFQGGIMSIDEAPVKGNELKVIVLCSVYENQMYLRPFDPKVPAPPDCYAFSDPDATEDPEDHMAPHKQVETPQSDKCASCPKNVMGTADTGKGKACKNVRRLAVVVEDAMASPEALEAAEVRMCKIPVMSVLNWAKYVKKTLSEELELPYWGVVTRMWLTPDKQSQFRVNFEFVEKIKLNDKLYAALKKKLADVKPSMTAPYPKFEEPPEEAPKRGGGRAAAQAKHVVARQPAGKAAPAKRAGKY